MKYPVLLIGAVLLSGCGSNLSEVGRPPALSVVGDGLRTPFRPSPASDKGANPSAYALWDGRGEDLFRDLRARRVGDVLTVTISIDEKAKLDNKTDRSRDSKSNLGFSFLLDVPGKYAEGAAQGDIQSRSSSKGAGKIDRTEEMKTSIAAVVTHVYPNGNLVISGSQEILVNYEMRVLHVAGIVRPRDILRNNTIPYERVAEARISYGGRGRLMEVQQPAWGQQIYDQLTPF